MHKLPYHIHLVYYNKVILDQLAFNLLNILKILIFKLTFLEVLYKVESFFKHIYSNYFPQKSLAISYREDKGKN